MWGTRAAKYRMAGLPIQELVAQIKIDPPVYPFAAAVSDEADLYKSWVKVTELMIVNVLGFQSHRDDFAIAMSRDEVVARIDRLLSQDSDEVVRREFGLTDNRDWQLGAARRFVKSYSNSQDLIRECDYRPLDRRWCYFSEVAMDYPRKELKLHSAGKQNWLLATMRQTRADSWAHALVAGAPAPAVYVEIKDGCTLFPLYLYPNPENRFEVKTEAPGGRRPNLSPEFITALSSANGLSFLPDGKGTLEKTYGPEDVFGYLYAILHAPTYRSRYAEFLKIDFPRIPLPGSPALFKALVAVGQRLVALHLMETVPDFPMPDYSGPARPTVEKASWANGRLSLGKGGGSFEPVPEAVWEFHIGGYQVCEKWLKDRKGRSLSEEDIAHYRRIVGVLGETIRRMEEIDGVIEEHGGWPGAFGGQV